MSTTLSLVSTHLSVRLGDSNVSSTGLQLMLVQLLKHVTVLDAESETERLLKIITLVLKDVLKAFSN